MLGQHLCAQVLPAPASQAGREQEGGAVRPGVSVGRGGAPAHLISVSKLSVVKSQVLFCLWCNRLLLSWNGCSCSKSFGTGLKATR